LTRGFITVNGSPSAGDSLPTKDGQAVGLNGVPVVAVATATTAALLELIRADG
jgi:hypothetical protein